MRSVLLVFCLAAAALSGCGREQSPEQQQADSLITVARKSFSSGSYRESREQLAASLALNTQLGRTQKIADAHRLLGDIEATVAHYDSALSFYLRAIELYRSVADRETVHSLTLRIAEIHHWIGEDRKAFSMYTESLRLARLFEDPVAVRETEWAMIPICRTLDLRDEESRILMDILRDTTVSGFQQRQAQAFLEAGISNLHWGNHSAAEENLLRALTLSDQSRDSVLSITILLKLAITYASAGRTTEAFQMFTDGLQRSDVTSGAKDLREEMLIRVGNIYLRNKQYSQAALFYRTALTSTFSTQNKASEGYLTIQLGHATESTMDAVNNYRSALDLFSGFSYTPGRAYALKSLGSAAQRRNQLSEALQYFKSAIEQQEAGILQRGATDLYADCEASSFPGSRSTYSLVTELLLQLGRYDEAFWYMERERGRETFDDFTTLDIATRDSTLTRAFNRFSHLKALYLGAERQRERLMMTTPHHLEMLHEVEASIGKTSREMGAVAEHVIQSNKDFESMVTIHGLGISEVQKLLPVGVALVSHFPTARAVYSFAINKARVAVQVAAVERSRVLSETKEFTDLLRTREVWKDSTTLVRKMDRRIDELSSSLYGMFIRPIEQDLAGATRLVIAPRNEFAAVPMHALRPFSGRAGSPYLIERYPVSYIPSASGLVLSNKSRATNSGSYDVVAMGHPGETAWDVEYELRDIRAFYKDARLHFDQQATISRLQSEHGDILHIAAEVNCDELNPANTTITLSDGKSKATTKQILLGELFSLPSFSAVLLSNLGSPCAGGESLIPEILLSNGNAVVVTNTYLPTRKTKKFFGEIFYTTLLSEATPAAAFRQAQLEMIKNREYSLPHLWAPFVLWGK